MASGRPVPHSGRFTFVEWDKDQPTNRSLSTQHVTREIRRKKRLEKEAAKKSTALKDPYPNSRPTPLPSPPTTIESSISPGPSHLSVESGDYFNQDGPAAIANRRFSKSMKQRKSTTVIKSGTISKSGDRPRPEITRAKSGLSIWQLLSNGEGSSASSRLLNGRVQPVIDQYARSSPVLLSESLPSPLDALTSHRGYALGGMVVPNPADQPLLDYWLSTAPRILHLDILPPSQGNRKPAHEMFFPFASRASEALEHLVMLPAALSWAKSIGYNNPYVISMVNSHRAKCVQYLNEAITRLVDEKVMEEHTHIGLMSLIWAENMYGDAAQARAYSLVFREMVQLRVRQKIVPPRREATTIANWYNALTTVDFWPKGLLNNKEMADAENLLKPLFPFLESIRNLAHQRRLSTISAFDRQRYLSARSPLTMILLSSQPFDTSIDSSNDAHHKFMRLLLFRVLLFLHIGLLDMAAIRGPGRLSHYYDDLEHAIEDADIVSSPSPLALLLWTLLNDPRLSAVNRHKDVGMFIYPMRRLGTEWIARLNRLLLTWLGLTDAQGSFPSESVSVSALLRADWEADQLPAMLTNLIIGSRTPTPESEDSPASSTSRPYGAPVHFKVETSPQGSPR